MAQADGEETRAAEYRRMAQAREDNKLQLEQSLLPSNDAREIAYQDWKPLYRDPGWDPIRKTIRDDDADGVQSDLPHPRADRVLKMMQGLGEEGNKSNGSLPY